MDYMNHKDDERMIYALAHRVKRRLAEIPNVVMSYDDIEQDLWVAWCRARNAFDPSRGVPWPAFLQRGMRQHINREIDRLIERFEGQTFAMSLNEKIGNDGKTELMEVIPGAESLPCEIAERESNYKSAISVLSDRAKIFVSLLREQPPELLHEVMVAQDKAEHAVKLGAPYNVTRRITVTMVFDLMGAPRVERNQITEEVKALGVRMSA